MNLDYEPGDDSEVSSDLFPDLKKEAEDNANSGLRMVRLITCSTVALACLTAAFYLLGYSSMYGYRAVFLTGFGSLAFEILLNIVLLFSCRRKSFSSSLSNQWTVTQDNFSERGWTTLLYLLLSMIL